MEQTDLLTKLLNLAQLNLSPNSLEVILEHEKWALREQHKHEKEMRQLEVRLGITTQSNLSTQETTASDNSDHVFNSDTSHNQCGPEHIGLIAKMKVGAGANLRAKDLPNPEQLPIQLLSLAISISWCGERMGKWPNAKDTKVALGLREELTKAVEKYGPVRAIKAIDLVAESLLVWDPRIVHEQLDKLRPEAERLLSMEISSSPLFAEFRKEFPHINPDVFNICYNQNNRNFMESSLYLLKREFRNVPPKELEFVEGWGQRWQQYLPKYLEQWKNDLKSMETRMRVAQRAWKESIS